METLKLCVAYELDGERVDAPPSVGLERVTPIYEELPGWSEDVTAARSVEALPAKARAYVERVEQLVGIPASILSVGPDRAETIERLDPWR